MDTIEDMIDMAMVVQRARRAVRHPSHRIGLMLGERLTVWVDKRKTLGSLAVAARGLMRRWSSQMQGKINEFSHVSGCYGIHPSHAWTSLTRYRKATLIGYKSGVFYRIVFRLSETGWLTSNSRPLTRYEAREWLYPRAQPLWSSASVLFGPNGVRWAPEESPTMYFGGWEHMEMTYENES